MKGDRLFITISKVEPLAKGVVIACCIQSGRLSFNQTVYLHDTANNRTKQCTIVDIRSADTNIIKSQAKKGDKITSYLIGAFSCDFIIGQTYIGGTIKACKFRSEQTNAGSKNKTPRDSECTNPIVEITSHITSTKTERLKANLSVLQTIEAKSAAEKDLIASIKTCINNGGCISATERYLIATLAESYNISKVRCEELITQCLRTFDKGKSLTIFRNAVLTCLLDSNYISDTEFLLLGKLRQALCISEDVAHDIIYQCNWLHSESIKKEK